MSPEPPGVEPSSDAVDPPYLTPEYRSTVFRAPLGPRIALPGGPLERSGPGGVENWAGWLGEPQTDLTRQHDGEPLGERIIVHGRVVDTHGRPCAGALVEVWQANAAGRYAHAVDQHPAPLDPNFTGAGFCVTDAAGAYRFVSIKPGAYPWRNHDNAWRPAHIHFSLVAGFRQRLVTQMYFPGDPLLEYDPIFNSVPSVAARRRLIAEFDWKATIPEWALGYRFDIVLAAPTPEPGSGRRP